MFHSRGDMSNKKHRTSGHSKKGPRLRLYEKMEAEKNEKKPRKFKLFSSVRELFRTQK